MNKDKKEHFFEVSTKEMKGLTDARGNNIKSMLLSDHRIDVKSVRVILGYHLIGEINNKTGFVIDFYDIDHVFNNYVHSKIDHKVLNDVEGLDNPTSENLAKWIWNILHPHLAILSKVTVSEDHGTGIIYQGE